MKNGRDLTFNQSHKGSAFRPLLLGWLALAFVVLPLVDAQAQGPTRFEADIQAFERADQASPPPEDPILFVGSSSIRVWPDLPGDFPDYPVMNRGFGGSPTGQLLSLVNTQNKPTQLGLQILSPFNASGPNTNGTLESIRFTQNATRDSLFGNTETFSNRSDVFPSFKLTENNNNNNNNSYHFTYLGVLKVEPR